MFGLLNPIPQKKLNWHSLIISLFLSPSMISTLVWSSSSRESRSENKIKLDHKLKTMHLWLSPFSRKFNKSDVSTSVKIPLTLIQALLKALTFPKLKLILPLTSKSWDSQLYHPKFNLVLELWTGTFLLNSLTKNLKFPTIEKPHI